MTDDRQQLCGTHLRSVEFACASKCILCRIQEEADTEDARQPAGRRGAKGGCPADASESGRRVIRGWDGLEISCDRRRNELSYVNDYRVDIVRFGAPWAGAVGAGCDMK